MRLRVDQINDSDYEYFHFVAESISLRMMVNVVLQLGVEHPNVAVSAAAAPGLRDNHGVFPQCC